MIEHDDTLLRTMLLAYLSERSKVSAQHKLPTISELVQSGAAEYFSAARIEAMAQKLVAEGSVFRYGPHFSTRRIETL